MQVFYYDGALENTIELNEIESQHASKVLRKSVGDRVIVRNGRGIKGDCEIINITKKSVKLKVLNTEESEQKLPKLVLIVAPPKSNDRFNFLIEKSVEIGVDEIHLLNTKNSERNKVNQGKTEHLIKAAFKQSKRDFIPKLFPFTKVKEFLSKDNGGNKFIAYCENLPATSLADITLDNTKKSATLVIGPEGDFTPEEVALFKEAGYSLVNLGKNRLRTETAALAGLTLLKSKIR